MFNQSLSSGKITKQNKTTYIQKSLNINDNSKRYLSFKEYSLGVCMCWYVCLHLIFHIHAYALQRCLSFCVGRIFGKKKYFGLLEKKPKLGKQKYNNLCRYSGVSKYILYWKSYSEWLTSACSFAFPRQAYCFIEITLWTQVFCIASLMEDFYII